MKVLLFSNLVGGLPKNGGLYFLGVLFMLFYGRAIPWGQALLGLAALLITYSSVYVFNDVWDVEEDRKDAKKTRIKPVASGRVSKREALILGFALLLPGIALSWLSGFEFFLAVCGLMAANLLYSAPGMRLKKTFVGIPLIAAAQFLKILLPWTLAGLDGFPYMLALGYSLVYYVFLRTYKKDMDGKLGDCFMQNKAVSAAIIAVFLLSLLVHPYPLRQAVMYAFMLGAAGLLWNTGYISRRFVLGGAVYIIISLLAIVWIINTFKVF